MEAASWKLGLGFVCAWSRDLNAERGRPSISPVVFFKVPSYHGTETYKKAIRQHQTWVESLLAEAKEWHGLRRPRLCGLLIANIQGLLFAVGAEPETHPGRATWGSRHAPCGSLLARSTEPGGFRPYTVVPGPAGD